MMIRTLTCGLPCQCISRCFLTPSIFPTYYFNDSDFKNDTIAPLTRLWSSPLNSNMFRSPKILRGDCVWWLESALLSLVNTNLFAAGPEIKTVGLPKRLSFDIGPYFLILCSGHFSAVLARMALRRPRLWPIKGIPSKPGGSLFDDLLPFLRRKKMGMRNREIARKIFMIYVWLLVFWSGGGKWESKIGFWERESMRKRWVWETVRLNK